MPIDVLSRTVLSLPHHFAELRKNIEPPRERREAAATIPDEVRTFLEDQEDYATLSPHSRLTGSYARSTAIHSIKDVDFVVLIDPVDDDDIEPEDALDDLYAALQTMPEAIGRAGLVQMLRRQRRSIHVYFEDEDFHLDIVPAKMPDGIDESLWVPDREWSKWIESDPLGYNKALSTLNADSGEKAVPLIKLFKHWRTVQMQRRRPKSYWLEALVYRHLDRGWVATAGKSYAELFTDLLRSVRDRFQAAYDEDRVPRIPDPMLGHNVAESWELPAFRSFMSRLNDSIGWAERALAKDRDEIDEAIELWQKVFGDEYFTNSSDARRLQFAEWAGSSSLFVTGAGRVLTKKPTDQPTVASRPHNFYGDAK